MSKEQLINEARRNLGLSTKDKNFELLEGIWNAAIESAAQETYKSIDQFEINESILSLKFDKDENK